MLVTNRIPRGLASPNIRTVKFRRDENGTEWKTVEMGDPQRPLTMTSVSTKATDEDRQLAEYREYRKGLGR